MALDTPIKDLKSNPPTIFSKQTFSQEAQCLILPEVLCSQENNAKMLCDSQMTHL